MVNNIAPQLDFQRSFFALNPYLFSAHYTVRNSSESSVLNEVKDRWKEMGIRPIAR
jgi:hypothetical protein